MSIKHAIIIPYRDRKEHLDILLPVLKNYNADIYIFEQNTDTLFNRGQLFNSILSIEKQYDYYIFHDVDLIPDLSNDYIRPYDIPTHLSCYCEQFNYKILDNVIDIKDSNMFGGVIAMSSNHFKLLNGFNSLYEGWGYEDNDMIRKIKNHNINIDRLPWRYKSLKHYHDDLTNPNLITNQKIYNDEKTMLINSDMILKEHYDNIYWYKVDIIPRSINCTILYYKTLSKCDLDICLLSAYQKKTNVILSYYGISQSMLNYYGEYDESIYISDDIMFIHFDDLLYYILNKKVKFKQHNNVKTFHKYDYGNYCFVETNIYPPSDINDSIFNYFIYKLLNTDLHFNDCYNLTKHYIDCGKSENRPISFCLNEFNIFDYYEFNHDLHQYKIFDIGSLSCIDLINHYKHQGKNEHRIRIFIGYQKLQNVDWKYKNTKVLPEHIYEYLQNKYTYESSYQCPLIDYYFDDIDPIYDDRTLIMTHPGGGGVGKFLSMLQECFPKNIVLKPNPVKMNLYMIDDNETTYYNEFDIVKIHNYICQYKISLILVNHACIFVPQMFKMLYSIKEKYQCKILIFLHDLTYYIEPKELTFNDYRKKLLMNADKIISPSQYIKYYYRHLCDVDVISHPDMYPYTITMNEIVGEFKILIIGYNKGHNEIKEFLQHIDNNTTLIHLGGIDIDICSNKLLCKGSYNDSEILNIIKEINPNLIWFPSIVPEAYCYALSYAILSGYPIVAHSIGANIERLIDRPCSWLITKPLHEEINSIKMQYENITININNSYITKEEYFNILLAFNK